MNNEPSISVEHLSFRYQRRKQPAIQDINFTLQQGQVMLIAGASGCGKTTLMRCINGLIPNTYHGEKSGDVHLFGKSVFQMEMAEISQTVGTLLQDPERQILGSYVLNEVAFGLESLGVTREQIVPRVEQSLERLGISHLRERETFGTSGGEKQKIALAGVLVMEPKILLLDEPLASLDPASAHEALLLMRRLADEGITIMVVEHRVEDVLAIDPEVVLYLDEGQCVYQGDEPGLMRVVDYRRIKLPAYVVFDRAKGNPPEPFTPAIRPNLQQLEPIIHFEDVHFQYNTESPPVLEGINCTIHAGDVIAILGHNGSGKTTMVKHALGLLKPNQGRVTIDGHDTRKITVAQAAHTVGYVFQSPSQMLFAPTVAQELAFGPKNLGFTPQEIEHNVSWAIETVNLRGEMETPPLALSFGQQKRISIAAVLAMRSRVLVMDEPTAGQDYWNYRAFMEAILQMPDFDAVIFITHDLDLAILYANRIMLLYNGKLVADGAPQDVLKEQSRLKACRILPTSLLQLNLELLPVTNQFYSAETLANLRC